MAGELQYLDYEGLSSFKGMLNDVDIVTTAGDGAAYTATIPGVTELKVGFSFTMVPHVVSTTNTVTLNVNGLGAKAIRRRVSNSTVTTVLGSSDNWIAANKPIRVTYEGRWWIADLDIPNATDIYGIVAVENGGTGGTSPATARENIGAVNMNPQTVSLLKADWSDKKQTVMVAGVTADNTVLVGPAPESLSTYNVCSVRCIAQAARTLTFECDMVPKYELTVNVVILT